ncbi:acetyl-CoA synthetase-like protein, partial [Aureobasidium melanogenum]
MPEDLATMNGETESYAILHGGDPLPIKQSIWTSFTTEAKEKPDHIVIISRTQPADLLASVVGTSSNVSTTGLEWTWSQIIQGGLTIASVFNDRGVKPNSVLLAFLPSVCAEWSLLWMAANCFGVTLVTIDKRALEPARVDELTFYIRSLQPGVVVVHDSTGVDAVDRVCAEVQHSVDCKLTFDAGDGAHGWIGLASSDVSNHPKHYVPNIEDRDLNRIAAILFTSGTSTGQPKGCPLTEKNILHGWSVQNPVPATNTDMPLKAIMMFANSRAINLHLSGLCWVAGGTLVYLTTGFTPEGMLTTIEQENITSATFIPPMLSAVAKHPSFSKEKVKSLARILVGGDIASTDLQGLATEYFPNAQLLSGWAMTEGLWVTGWPSNQAPEQNPTSMGLLAQGTALPGNVLKIVDHEGGIAKRGEPGDMHVQSACIINAYRDNVASDTFYEDKDGRWFKTGDVGFVDDNGLIYVLGRKKDILKRLGIPIPPILLENVLSQFGGVQASVFGLPNPKLGEEAVAVVSDMTGTTRERLQDLAVEHLGPDYPISKVFTLQELGMQKFPVNVTGKVMKIELRKAVEDLLSRESLPK